MISHRLKEFIYYYFPPLLWMGVIFYFSSLHRVKVSDEYFLNFIFFKSLHVIEYFILGFLSLRGVFKRSFYLLREKAILAFMISFFYATTDEYHQTFILTRNGAVRDVLIDSLGILLSLYLYLVFRKKLLRKYDFF